MHTFVISLLLILGIIRAEPPPQYIVSTVASPQGPPKEISVDLPDKVAINIHASPMSPLGEYDLEQFLGNAWTWSLNYTFRWENASYEYLARTRRLEVCTLTQPKRGYEPGIEAKQNVTVKDMDFLGGDLFYVDPNDNTLKVIIIPAGSSRFANMQKPREQNATNVTFLSCNSDRGPFCILYKNTTELCKMYKDNENMDVTLVNCTQILSNPERVQLLNDRLAAVYYRNSIDLYSVAEDKAINKVGSYTGDKVKDIAPLWDSTLVLCLTDGISIIGEASFSAGAAVAQFSTKCKRIGAYKNTIIAYQEVEAANTSRTFLTEFLVTDPSSKTIQPTRVYNVSAEGPEIAMGDSTLVVDDKYAYLFIKETGLFMVKHSLPQNLQPHINFVPRKGQAFALSATQNRPYTYETDSYFAIYKLVVNTGGLYFYPPYKIEPGTLTCLFSTIADMPQLSLELYLSGIAADCPEKAQNYSFNTYCKFTRTININQRYKEPEESTNALIYLVIIIPIVLIVVGVIYLMGFSGGRVVSEEAARQPIRLVSLRQYEEAGIHARRE